ncbi:N-acetylmuramoyl-L-alanine amidase [Ruegeria sp. HKCCA6837]|uniref:N-acetylmuramoyl-L-alanine amidase n=1 Tax=Ruegeria sp. HKCCA6837 TaxID=2682989 RepID=UPI001488B01A|nr:N-acetylmuramoyl-L-alanine amidase [Ruegeria sp. HKCCA6837]
MLAAGTQARSAVLSTIELSPIWHPSPNFGERRDGLTPSLIVIHYTAMDSAQAALERLCDLKAEVSAHYLIGNDGTLWQMVREEHRAWHAGAGEWDGKDDINSRSIGIELDNTGSHPFSEPQMTTLEALLPRIMKNWSIPASGVIGHSDMAPGRKSDPGPHFDWQRLERQALAKPRGPDIASASPSPGEFRAAARRAGFTAPVDDVELLAAVRLRFRPWANGPLETADMKVLAPPDTVT